MTQALYAHMNNKKIKIIKKHPPMAQHVPGDAQVPTMELHFKRLN
jgi:2-oxo-4-hydroxy-4-carboxy--5-ureidoimidazoline (OHCU) decarboxylase